MFTASGGEDYVRTYFNNNDLSAAGAFVPTDNNYINLPSLMVTTYGSNDAIPKEYRNLPKNVSVTSVQGTMDGYRMSINNKPLTLGDATKGDPETQLAEIEEAAYDVIGNEAPSFIKEVKAIMAGNAEGFSNPAYKEAYNDILSMPYTIQGMGQVLNFARGYTKY